MKRRILAVWLSIAMIFSIVVIIDVTTDFTPTVRGATLYVNTTGTGAYSKIQDAIDNASDGFTVFVYSGTYYENVVVNKTINLTGEDKNTTVIDGGGGGDVVRVIVNYVNITGFSITGSGSNIDDAGMKLENVQNCKIYNNNISLNNNHGIGLFSSSNNNFIYHNNIIDNANQAYDDNPANNDWHHPTLLSGNYWSDYTGMDDGSGTGKHGITGDGIGDTNNPHPGADYDNYMLMNQITFPPSFVWVDDDFPIEDEFHFNTIQKGVGAVARNGTVFVYSGTYYENVWIDKKIDLIGENKENTIIDKLGSTYIINIRENGIKITGFTIRNHGKGIHIYYSSNNNIINNNILNNGVGIYLDYSSNNNITNNNISENGNCGIRIDHSPNNNITNNIISNNWFGIWQWKSTNNYIINNTFINDGIYFYKQHTSLAHFNTHTISDNNIVNGKPLRYYKNTNGMIIDGDTMEVGELILVNCTDMVVKDLKISNTDIAIQAAFCTYSRISNNNVSFNTLEGISVFSSSNITITNNNVSNIVYEWAQFPEVHKGIHLYNSSDSHVLNNNVSNNMWDGISLWKSSNNTILNNCILDNERFGIFLYESSSYNLVTYNVVTNNSQGIATVDSSFNNTVTNNEVSCNSNGFNISSSSNRIYHNNIIDNTNQAKDWTGNNFWDNGYPSGGNYWSDFDEPSEGAYDDYKGLNQDVLGSDGIVDNGTGAGGGKNPYVIDFDNQDNYPLMAPIGNIAFLYEGWNLISIPFIQTDTDLSMVLKPIDGSFNIVEYYNVTDNSDHWKVNISGKPYGNDLSEMNEKMGFWIHVTESGGVLFEYSGTQPTENQTISLHPGWNLVGYPSLTNKNRTTALNNLTFGNQVDSIWTYNAKTHKWEELNEPTDYFQIGKGYWIHAKTKCEWEVPL